MSSPVLANYLSMILYSCNKFSTISENFIIRSITSFFEKLGIL